MAAKAVHPTYTAMEAKWTLGRDSYEGEDAIKAKTTTYLPATSGQLEDGQGKPNQPGQAAYQAYLTRAVYPDIYADAVEAAIGILHRKPPVVELPDSMKDLETNATLLGESIEMLLRRINTQQLKTGRIGILGDIKRDKGDKVRPIIATYNELAIRNWDDTSKRDDDVDVSLVVLDESGYERQPDFSWVFKNRYRALCLVDEQGVPSAEGVYASALLDEDDELLGKQFEKPNHMGTTLDEIPFVFINSKDLSPTPDKPPLQGLAKLCLAIYRGEADYRQNLFMQGQDTLVRIGAQGDLEDPVRTGAGARIDVPLGGDAKYIGVNSQGLPEQRSALENDYKRAIQKSGQLLDATSRTKESGDALKIRVAAQTATLPVIAKAGAAGLEKVLKILARWLGADPEKVSVKPNLEFTEADLNGQTLVQIIQAKSLGAPLSKESIHEWLVEQGFTRQTYDEEISRLEKEEPASDVPGLGGDQQDGLNGDE